jgi:uncharacterized membrane protein
MNNYDDYLKQLHSRLMSSNDNEGGEENVLNEIETVLNRIEKLKRNEKFRKMFRVFGVFVLIVGLMVLGWNHIYIHVVYIARLIVITVFVLKLIFVFFY